MVLLLVDRMNLYETVVCLIDEQSYKLYIEPRVVNRCTPQLVSYRAVEGLRIFRGLR